MTINNKKEERIQKNFNRFFDNLENNTWRSSDLKKFNKYLYRVLCAKHKDPDCKVDREAINQKFISENNRKKFQARTNYNKALIKKTFEEFFEHQKEKGKNTWNTSELNVWKETFANTLSQRYGKQNKQYVDREKCIKDNDLENSECIFTRQISKPVHINIKRIEKDIYDIISSNKKRSPTNLKPQYLRWLKKHYPDKKGKIDRFNLLYSGIFDNTLIDYFTHRYGINRSISVPMIFKEKSYIEINMNRGIEDIHQKNPEEILIQKESYQNNEKILKIIYKTIENILSKEEKKQLRTYLTSDTANPIDSIEINEILSKIKTKLNGINPIN